MQPQAKDVVVAFFIFCISLAAQESVPPKTEKALAKDACGVAGQVVKLGSNEPLKKARIYLQKEDDQKVGYSAHTDAAGHFSVQNVEPGRYELRVDRAGYVSQSYGQDSSSAKSHGAILTLDPGRKIQDLVFRMVAWAVISGRVTDEDGDPVPNVEVQALRHSFSEGNRTLESEGDAQTDDLGEFRLYGLAKGRYFIRAQAQRDWQPVLSEPTANDAGSNPETGYAPVYYPGTTDASHAAAIEVSPGQEVPSVDFTFIPVRTFRIRGRAFDALQGQPAKDCWLFLMPHDPGLTRFTFGPGSQTTCNKGAFEFRDVPPGSYYVEAMLRSSSSEKSGRARAPVEVTNTNVDDVNLTIGPGIALVGRVLVEEPGTVDLSDLRVWLEDREDQFGFAGVDDVDLKPDGTLRIQNVAEGAYQVRIYGEPPDVYLRSARANGEDVLEKGLTIAAGTSPGPLEIVLSSGGARIEGTVADENSLPSPGAVVALVPEGERRKQYRLYKNTTTDQYGKFILRGVAPGRYKLFSWKEVENDAWEYPDFLKPFETKGVEVSAEEKGHTTAALKLIPTEVPK